MYMNYAVVAIYSDHKHIQKCMPFFFTYTDTGEIFNVKLFNYKMYLLLWKANLQVNLWLSRPLLISNTLSSACQNVLKVLDLLEFTQLTFLLTCLAKIIVDRPLLELQKIKINVHQTRCTCELLDEISQSYQKKHMKSHQVNYG